MVLVGMAWSNTLHAPFVLDDHSSVLGNVSIREITTLEWMHPPASAGETVSGRPMLNLTFALNHAFGGTSVVGYRVFNGLLHVVAGLLLYGVIRNTIERAGVGPSGGDRSQPGRRSEWYAGVAALCWAVHPLQTAAVSYVAQRAEVLAALFLLLMLYCFLRSVGRLSCFRCWMGASVVACALGMASKESMVGAPLVVLLYDRVFLVGSFVQALRERWRFYAALAGTWLLLVVLVWPNHGRGGSAGFGTVITPWPYFLTQCEAIPRYVGLVFCPAGLVFDYGMPTVSGVGSVWAGLLALSLAALATVWALWRNRVEGFLGACFFVLLAPSSSVVPVATQTIAEHRMYLPSALIILLAGLVLFRIPLLMRSRWMPVAFAGTIVATLGAATWARNQVYRSARILWSDTVEKRPDSPRARVGLGQALLVEAGDAAGAITQFRKAIELQPDHPFAHYNLGTVLLQQQQYEEAASHLRIALAGDPRNIDARINLGQALTGLERTNEAIEQYSLALAQDPAATDAATNLGALLVTVGRCDEGERLLRGALKAAPDLAEAHFHLGRALERRGDFPAAETSLRNAIRYRPQFSAAQVALARCLSKLGDGPGAEASLREALRLEPRSFEAHYALGNLLAKQRRFAAAMEFYRAAIELAPEHVQARTNLGNCLLVTGRVRDAIAAYEEVLRRRPDDETVRRNLAVAREQIGAE
jgi:tetratricopeptide (TPR) repeat protein